MDRFVIRTKREKGVISEEKKLQMAQKKLKINEELGKILSNEEMSVYLDEDSSGRSDMENEDSRDVCEMEKCIKKEEIDPKLIKDLSNLLSKQDKHKLKDKSRCKVFKFIARNTNPAQIKLSKYTPPKFKDLNILKIGYCEETNEIVGYISRDKIWRADRVVYSLPLFTNTTHKKRWEIYTSSHSRVGHQYNRCKNGGLLVEVFSEGTYLNRRGRGTAKRLAKRYEYDYKEAKKDLYEFLLKIGIDQIAQ